MAVAAPSATPYLGDHPFRAGSTLHHHKAGTN